MNHLEKKATVKKLFFITVCMAIGTVSGTAWALSVHEDWLALYDGPAHSLDSAHEMAVDSSGNVYVTGWSTGSTSGSDFATVKYSAAGIEQWVARYNGPANADDYCYAIAVDTAGNVYVTGWSAGSGTGTDYATVMYDTDGIEQWVARYNGPANTDDYCYAIAVDTAGNVYVTGGSTGSSTSSDYATVMYDSDGIEQWVARYNGPASSYDSASAVAVDDSGNIYVLGSSTGSATGSDYATVMYDSDGIEQWAARYDGPPSSDDYGYDIVLDGTGNVCVTGWSTGTGTSSDYTTIMYDSEGIEQWVARYDGPANSYDIASDIAVDAAGNVCVTGWSTGTDTVSDYTTVMYDPDGIEQWVARYDGPANSYDIASDIAVDAAGNVYVAGWSTGTGTSYDYAVVMYDSEGSEQWVARYDGPASSFDLAFDIAVTATGTVYVTGWSYYSETFFSDYATIKYIQVKKSSEALEDLMRAVHALNLPRGIEKWLMRKLQKARNALDAGRPWAAVIKIKVFIHAVKVLRNRKLITKEQADDLVAMAKDVIHLIISELNYNNHRKHRWGCR